MAHGMLLVAALIAGQPDRKVKASRPRRGGERRGGFHHPARGVHRAGPGQEGRGSEGSAGPQRTARQAREGVRCERRTRLCT
jgi:hypothetical protein